MRKIYSKLKNGIVKPTIEALTKIKSFLRKYAGETAVLLFCLTLTLWQLGSARLFDLDEGLYVACAKQMVLTGDIVTPQLNTRPLNDLSLSSVPFFEKPIMVYWVCAASLRVFGMSEFAARLPAALATLATTLLVVLSGKKWFGKRAGLLAGLVYATAPMTILDGRQMTTDSLLVLWFTGAMLALQAKRPFLFWTMCALSILTKGIIGILLPTLVIFALLFKSHATFSRKPVFPFLTVSFREISWFDVNGKIKRMRPLLGIALLMLIVLPWHIAIWRAGGHDSEGRTWVQEYLIRQHVGRFQGIDKVHNAPFFTYIGYLLIGFFPWACFIPMAFRVPKMNSQVETHSRSTGEKNRNAYSKPHAVYADFALVWFWTIFIFFSISSAKLPTYIVPAYPAAAALVGRWLDEKLALRSGSAGMKGIRGGALFALSFSALLLCAGLALPYFNGKNSFMPQALIPFVIHVFLILLVGCLTSYLLLRFAKARSGFRAVFAYASTTFALLLLLGFEGYPLINQHIFQPYQDMAIRARRDALLGTTVIFHRFRDRRPSMLYYSDYTPIEKKEAPLLPILFPLLRGGQSADVVISRKNFESSLMPELQTANMQGKTLFQSETDGGEWLLVRVSNR